MKKNFIQCVNLATAIVLLIIFNKTINDNPKIEAYLITMLFTLIAVGLNFWSFFRK